MKKIICLSVLVALSASALVGCGEDDGGKLSGTYANSMSYADGSVGEKKIIVNYKKPDYELVYQVNNGEQKIIGVMKKSGDYLVSDGNNEKEFEIKDDGKSLKSLSDPSQTVYVKKGS